MTPGWLVAAATLTVLMGCAPVEPGAGTGATRAGEPEPTWEWSHDRVAEFWLRVQPGRRLVPSEWPNGARVAVALSFDFQMGTIYDPATPLTSVNTNSQFDGRVGLPRVLALLRRHRIPASFFVTGITAHLHPETVEAIVADGQHEVGVHGWLHENPRTLPAADERRLMENATAAIAKASGKRPVGYRTPAWEYSESTLTLVKELGFLYDSGMMADDMPYELILDGEASGVIEMPVEWVRDDAPHFRRQGALSPGDVYEIWQSEFEHAYEEGGVFQLTMHPRIIGHGSRIRMLDRLLSYIGERDDVWFATHEQVVRHAMLMSSPGPQ